MTIAASSLDELAHEFSLSSDEISRLSVFDNILLETQSHTNLIARASIDDRWVRHYADSLQLISYIPDHASSWLDFGSGAGFPGLIVAAVMEKRRKDLRFTLCDSVKKKARFLQDAADLMGLENVQISQDRVETFHVKQQRFDVVSARAVASLEKLLSLACPLLSPEGLLIFPKGEKAESELTDARQHWTFKVESRPSMTHNEARILLLTSPEPQK